MTGTRVVLVVVPALVDVGTISALTGCVVVVVPVGEVGSGFVTVVVVFLRFEPVGRGMTSFGFWKK